MLTDRDYHVLESLARYQAANRAQISELHFPRDSGGRQARRRLQHMVEAGYVIRHAFRFGLPGRDSVAPVYYLSQKGLDLMAVHLDDPTIRERPVKVKKMEHLHHFLAVTQTHILLDQAIAEQHQVTQDIWHNEPELVNPDTVSQENRFYLFTQMEIDGKKIACSPDAAFQLSYRGYRSVFYVEQDRATYWPADVARRKHKGYHYLCERQLHKKHFPETNRDTFQVLCVTATAAQCTQLRQAFADKPGNELWRFASLEADQSAPETVLTKDTFLFEPIWYTTSGELVPLIKRIEEQL